MTLDTIIDLFEEIEAGKEGQVIGRHLHDCIAQANKQIWPMRYHEGMRFSDFLKALRAEDYPPPAQMPPE